MPKKDKITPSGARCGDAHNRDGRRGHTHGRATMNWRASERTCRRSNPGKRYSIRGPFPSAAQAARAGTTLLRLCSISTSALRGAAPEKIPIVALLSCDLTVASTSRLGAAAPAAVHELSRTTIHGVHGKKHPDPFRHMIVRSSDWSQTYKSTCDSTAACHLVWGHEGGACPGAGPRIPSPEPVTGPPDPRHRSVGNHPTPDRAPPLQRGYAKFRIFRVFRWWSTCDHPVAHQPQPRSRDFSGTSKSPGGPPVNGLILCKPNLGY